jgi:hypothetical protein
MLFERSTRRRAIASLGFVGALVCGFAATASVFTSDSMSKAVIAPHRIAQRDEVNANHADENGDDIRAISLVGLGVEIESPDELDAPPAGVDKKS